MTEHEKCPKWIVTVITEGRYDKYAVAQSTRPGIDGQQYDTEALARKAMIDLVILHAIGETKQ